MAGAFSFPSRRRFLNTSAFASGALLGGGWGAGLGRVRSEDLKLAPGSVQFRPEIEPLVRLLEETPRDKVLEKVAERIRSGLTYRELLAALLLAGIRNVEPRPSVGFQFHCVLVVHSAHQASLAAASDERWLPLLWAVDYFKGAQQRDASQGGWTMPAVDSSRLPDGQVALRRLRQAMERWDEDEADVAAAAAARHVSTGRLFNTMARYGSRDFRSIGHKAIYVAGAFRTLEVIGPEHAEPVMRSLAYALLNRSNEPNPAENDLMPDRDGRENWDRVEKLPNDWLAGKPDDEATAELVGLLRGASSGEACDAVVEMIGRGVHPASIYDALFLVSSELVMRQPAIVPLHAVTTSNAMHYLYRSVTGDPLRRWLLLQNTAFLVRFREAAHDRGRMADSQIDALAPAESASADEDAVEPIFANVRKDREQAARQMLGYLEAGGSITPLMRQARQWVFRKGNDSHDYKFSSAVLEDFTQISPAWRGRYLAGCSYLLRGESESDTALAKQAAELGV